MTTEMRGQIAEGHFRARWAVLFLYAAVGTAGLSVISGGLQWLLLSHAQSGIAISHAEAVANDSRHLLINRIQFAFFVVSAIVFLRWLFQAYANLEVMGSRNSHETPGWAVGYWFIPFVNLLKPYKIVKELWFRSQDGNIRNPGESIVAPATIRLWWTSYLIANLATRSALSLSSDTDSLSLLIWATIISAGADVLTVAAGLLLINIIQSIDTAQLDYAVAEPA